MRQTDASVIPVALVGLLALTIMIVTARHNPWHKKYGATAWDFSQSFAANLAALTGAITTVIAAATMTSTTGAELTKKVETMVGAEVFVVFTACAPLVASVWRTPANETFFGGVVAGILATAFGVFGQMQVLINLAPAQPTGLAKYINILYFADFAVFVYCAATANRLAHTPPVKTVMLYDSRDAVTVLDRCPLP